MCELLAVSNSRATRLTFSLHALASHGGDGSTTRDGWGVAFYQGHDVSLFREPAAAGDSALVRYLESSGPSTNLAISHIRHATQGSVQLANTQPFVRELGGRSHVFAHNGDLPGIYRDKGLSTGTYRPVGQTDSEHAFCALLSRLGLLWEAKDPPALEARLAVLTGFAADLRALGPANFLYSDGDALFAHGNRRFHSVSGRAEPPGLWCLRQECPAETAGTDDVAGVSVGSAAQSVVFVASVPLSDAVWRPLADGEILVVRFGCFVSDSAAVEHNGG